MTERFDVFLQGFDPAHPETPRQGLARVFGIEPTQAAQLLASLPRVVKRDLPVEDAQRYLRALQSFGGIAQLRPCVAASPSMRAVAPSMPPLHVPGSPPASAWGDPLAAAASAQPSAPAVEPAAPSEQDSSRDYWHDSSHDSWRDPPASSFLSDEVEPVASFAATHVSSTPPRSTPPDRDDWVATAELGVRHPPRSAPAPGLPLRPAYRRIGGGSVALGVLLLVASYVTGASSLHGPPALTGLLLDGMGLFFVGRGTLRLLL